MSRWTTAFASIAIIAFSLPAIAADDDLPRNIELKPGAAASDAADKTAEDTGTTTRQIVTEGKDAPAAEAPKEGAASEPAPAAPAPAGTRPRKGRNRASARAGTGSAEASGGSSRSCPATASPSRAQA
jgi:hypothetical protein